MHRMSCAAWPVRNNSRRDPYYRTNEYGHIQLSGTGTLDYHWIYWNSYLYTVSVPKSVPCSYPMRYTVVPRRASAAQAPRKGRAAPAARAFI